MPTDSFTPTERRYVSDALKSKKIGNRFSAADVFVFHYRLMKAATTWMLGLIDKEITLQTGNERQYWKDIRNAVAHRNSAKYKLQ